MVTAYYIMKMSKSNRPTDINEYYNTLCKTNINTLQHIKNRVMCRVCLKEGLVPILEIEESSDALDILCDFAGIDVNREDELPKHLCAICYKFVKSAILFKKVAKLSEETLKNPIKEEIIDSFSDNQDNYEDNKESVKTWQVSIASRKERKCKLKVTTKVQCYICNKVVNKSYYKEHLTMHDPNHHKYVCDICGKSFRLRCAYHNHSLRHGTGFPFKCQLCPYKGKYAELLKTHMRTHTGDYRYMCTECPARFLFKSNLNSHVLNKHKEKKHKCDACKRAFHTKLALQRHFEVDHLGIKSHVCNVCGNAFGYRNAMMKHQRRVHKRDKMMFSRMPSYLQAEDKIMEIPSP